MPMWCYILGTWLPWKNYEDNCTVTCVSQRRKRVRQRFSRHKEHANEENQQFSSGNSYVNTCPSPKCLGKSTGYVKSLDVIIKFLEENRTC